MQDIYSTFEFYKIQERLNEYAKTEIARERISELVMFDNEQANKEALLDLNEMMSIVVRFGPMPIATSASALKLIDLAKKTGLLTPRDLNLIAEDVLTAKAIIRYLEKIDVSYPRIQEQASKFFDLTNLEKEIHRVITNALTVADNATIELKEIRGKIKKTETVLQQRITSLSFTYAKFLNDNNTTIRDGHLVLPVKTVNKSSVPGIVFDVSDSGATTFIEPMEIVQLNNELTALKVEENDEVRRILKQLTALVLLQENEIINNNAIIAEFDFLIAKSNYAYEINANIAEYSKDPYIELDNARHPLIDQRKVVSNSYCLDGKERIIVISGPNAGGKTVSLKTVGLLVMMNQCGLAIPVNKAKLSFFNHIYIDIGDNQSLSDNLSTFSAHMTQLGEITQVVKGKDLVLIDELGTGTDPREGEALAFSIVKFLESKHVLAMISSHFNALKEYAFTSEHIQNSSMVFDEEKLLPTYKFRSGSPGGSYALDVASRYGISEGIVSEAKEFLKNIKGNDASELLSILQKKLDEASKLEMELKKFQKELEAKEKKLTNDESLIKERRDNLLKDVEEEKRQIIENAKEEVEEIISNLTKSDLKLHEVIALKKDLENLETNPETITYDEEVKEGDYVSIPSLNISGLVKRIQGNKAHITSDSGISFDTDVKKLHKISEPKNRKVRPSVNNYEKIINTNVGLEINLIGMHVEEAQEALMKYIDNCKLKRLGQVRIIHGFGSGALRKMTRNYLDNQGIKYRPGDATEGGGGATVAFLHD